jgi:hypothetical protein
MLNKLFGWKKKGKEVGREVNTTHPDVDPSMRYCPQCGDEYRAGIDRCHVCEVDLISGEDKIATLKKEAKLNGERSMEISPEDRLIAIRNGKVRDLKPYQVLLARHTIPALINGESGNCSKG